MYAHDINYHVSLTGGAPEITRNCFELMYTSTFIFQVDALFWDIIKTLRYRRELYQECPSMWNPQQLKDAWLVSF